MEKTWPGFLSDAVPLMDVRTGCATRPKLGADFVLKRELSAFIDRYARVANTCRIVLLTGDADFLEPVQHALRLGFDVQLVHDGHSSSAALLKQPYKTPPVEWVVFLADTLNNGVVPDMPYHTNDNENEGKEKAAAKAAKDMARIAQEEKEKAQARIAQEEAKSKARITQFEAQSKARITQEEAKSKARITQFEAKSRERIAKEDAQYKAMIAREEAQSKARIAQEEAQSKARIAREEAQSKARIAREAEEARVAREAEEARVAQEAEEAAIATRSAKFERIRSLLYRISFVIFLISLAYTVMKLMLMLILDYHT
jgi:hypothetical protein